MSDPRLKLTGQESSILVFLAQRPVNIEHYKHRLSPEAYLIAEYFTRPSDPSFPTRIRETGDYILLWVKERRDSEQEILRNSTQGFLIEPKSEPKPEPKPEPKQQEVNQMFEGISSYHQQFFQDNKLEYIRSFTVLWEGWECDSTWYVCKNNVGHNVIVATNHGSPYIAGGTDELEERISAYKQILKESEEVLALVKDPEI